MKIILAAFTILFFVSCSQPLFRSRKHISNGFDEESKQLKKEYANGERKKCNAFLYAFFNDTIGLNRLYIHFCKEDFSFAMGIYPFQKKSFKGKDERFMKFYYGKYEQKVILSFLPMHDISRKSFRTNCITHPLRLI